MASAWALASASACSCAWRWASARVRASISASSAVMPAGRLGVDGSFAACSVSTLLDLACCWAFFRCFCDLFDAW